MLKSIFKKAPEEFSINQRIEWVKNLLRILRKVYLELKNKWNSKSNNIQL